jgi:hypothetical protein
VTALTADLANIGDVIDYTFTLDDPDHILFDVINEGAGFSNLRFTLTGPDGAVFSNRTLYDRSYQSVFPLVPGDYRLRVSALYDETGSASFRLLPFSDHQAIAIETPVTGTMDGDASAKIFAFHADGGQRIALDFASFANASSTVNWYVRGPDGANLMENYSNGTDSFFTTTKAGRHYLVLNPQPNQSSEITYDFTLRNVATQEFALTPDQIVSRPFAVPFSQHDYVFSLAEEKTLYFDSHGSIPANWYLYDDQGLALDNSLYGGLNDSSPSNNLFTLGPGDYRLRLIPDGTTSPDYSFTLRIFQIQHLSFWVMLSVIRPATAMRIAYGFMAQGGEELFFDHLDGMTSHYEVFAPDGTRVYSYDAYYRPGEFIAWQAGLYKLIVAPEENVTDTTSFSFQLSKKQRTIETLDVGQNIAGSIERAGDEVQYQFTLDAPEQFHFDSHINTDNFRWKLVRDGLVLQDWNSFRVGVPVSILQLEAGNYDLDCCQFW